MALPHKNDTSILRVEFENPTFYAAMLMLASIRFNLFLVSNHCLMTSFPSQETINLYQFHLQERLSR
jgi:hypothetical protein